MQYINVTILLKKLFTYIFAKRSLERSLLKIITIGGDQQTNFKDIIAELRITKILNFF